MEHDRLVESTRFLLKSVRQLSDHFVETNDNVARSFESVRQDVSDIAGRLEQLEEALKNMSDYELLASSPSRQEVELPVRSDTRENLIPALNLPCEAIVDVYRNTPILLEPFARPCSISGRTLSGLISEVEFEVFAQGTIWIVETQDSDWVLLPKPGVLQRRTQMESLSRMFDLSEEASPPAEVDLLRLGFADVVEHGRRWYLREKGLIGLHSDPLKQSLEKRLRALEERFE